MTVRELIGVLECEPEDAEVRLAFQPSWPFEHSVGDVVTMDDAGSDLEVVECEGEWYVEEGEEGEVAGPFATEAEAESKLTSLLEAEDEEIGNVVWIGEGGQLGYLPAVASRALGWK